MASEPYFKFFTGDYLKDTQDLTTVEHGAYLLLMIRQWNKGPLPDDDKVLAKVTGMRLDAWRRIAPTIRAFFTVLPDGRLEQKRLASERESVRVTREKKAASGAMGGTAKALNNQESGLAYAKRTESERLADADIVTVRVREEDTGSLRSPAATIAAAQTLQPPTLVVVASPAAPAQLAPAEKDPRGSRLPEAWQPSASDRAYATERGLDPDAVAEDFRDYWHAKAGAAARKTNWSLTWKQRCRDLDKRQKARGSAPLLEAAKRPVPETAGKDEWNVAAVVEHCNALMRADGDGLWGRDQDLFSHLIADALNAGADPDRDIYPVMRSAARWPGGPTQIKTIGWFRANLRVQPRPVAAA